MNWCPGIKSIFESCDSETQIEVQKQFSRHFFYPNICHVCNCHDSESPLKKCGNCNMIYYCSQQHQKAHWPLHKNFCYNVSSALKHIPDEKNINNKMQLILAIENVMKKKLEPYEYEIIEYQKVCDICLEEDPKLLKPCSRCPHANFCINHQDDPAHEEFCSLYTICYLLDYYAIVFQEIPIPRMMEFAPRNSENTKLPNSMEEYMDIYFKPREGSKFNFPAKDVKMYVSQHFTRPLTLIYAMKQIDFKKPRDELIIHVLGASKREEKSLIEWEILFHWLSNETMKIKVVLVGPELSDASSPFSEGKELNLCKVCSCKGKSLKLQIQNILYKNYCEGENFVTPDIIIGFNLGIIAYDSWQDSILEVLKFKCPFVLTAFSKRDANDDRCVMEKEFNASAKIVKNPFACLRPKRSVIGDKVFYENQFLLIYNDLDVNHLIPVEKKEEAKFKDSEPHCSKAMETTFERETLEI